MIEIRKVSNKYKLYVNGEAVPDSNVIGEFLNNREDLPERLLFRIYLNRAYTSKTLFGYKISEINNLRLITFTLGSGNKWKKITINKFNQSVETYNLSFTFKSLKRDRKGISFNDFCEELEININLFNQERNDNIIFERIRGRNIGIFFNDVLLPLSIIEEVDRFSEIVYELRRRTVKSLKEKQNELKLKTLVTSFNFPFELKFSCEQYLIYFAQFLKDLGINATSNLKEEAGKVLFSVTPTNDIDALDKIREALAVYLNLPSSPIVYDDSFAAMRLQQQIENLQHSQRMAVREIQFSEKLLVVQSETIREKNITISQQQSVIEQQNNVIEKISSKSVMIDSVENKEELEKIYEGFEVGESKWLRELTGIKLNPATVIKTAVQNTFGKDERKSVLGLDEEMPNDDN